MGEEEKKDQNEGGDEKTLEEEIADIDFDDTDDLTDSNESSETKDETKDEKGASDETSSDDKKDEKEDKKEAGTEENSETSEEEKETEGEKETEKEKEGDPKDSQITKLMQEIERLSGLTKSELKPADEKKSEDDADKDEKKPDETSIYDFIGEIDMDDVSADPAVFNKILHNVIAKVQQQTTEQVLRSIPQVVMSQVQQQTYFKNIADNFYKDNADLVNVKQVVRACAQQVQQANPEWDVEKVFKETAVKTRETLGMSAVKINSDETIPSAEDAAFAKQKGGSKSNLKPQRSSLQMEIDEL